MPIQEFMVISVILVRPAVSNIRNVKIWLSNNDMYSDFRLVWNFSELKTKFIYLLQSEYGFLSWIDISVGKQVAQMNANHGRLSIMCQNPTNAILCLGHSKGVVTMWSPNEREPVARMWAHKQPLTSIAVGKSKIRQNYEIILCIILFLQVLCRALTL